MKVNWTVCGSFITVMSIVCYAVTTREWLFIYDIQDRNQWSVWCILSQGFLEFIIVMLAELFMITHSNSLPLQVVIHLLCGALLSSGINFWMYVFYFMCETRAYQCWGGDGPRWEVIYCFRAWVVSATFTLLYSIHALTRTSTKLKKQ